jgi:integrase
MPYRLTAAKLPHLPQGWHSDGHNGLHLKVTGNSRTWVMRYQVNGRRRFMGLGPLHLVSLADARQRATAARQQLLAGIDPIAARQAQRATQRLEAAKTKTFDEVATQFLDARASAWRSPRARTDFERSLKAHASRLLSLPVGAIDTDLVLAVLEPLWRTKPNLAGKLRQRLEAVLNYARARGLYAGANPAQWRGHLDTLLSKRPESKHHTALPFADVPAFVRQLRDQESTPARALEFAILTATRTAEVVGAPWSEIDLTAKVWTIPKERTKQKRQHRVPLSTAAVALLEALPRVGAFVFPSRVAGQSLSNGALRYALDQVGRADLTVHGFRATFRTWSGECTNFPRELCEVALGHAAGDATELAYARGDLLEKRRRLMQAWGDYCGQVRNKVVKLTA